MRSVSNGSHSCWLQSQNRIVLVPRYCSKSLLAAFEILCEPPHEWPFQGSPLRIVQGLQRDGSKSVSFSVLSGPSLNQGRAAHGSFMTPGGKIIVFRGTSGGSVFLDSVEALEGSAPVAWSFLSGVFSGTVDSAAFTYYPRDSGAVGGAISYVSGTTVRFVDLVSMASSTGPTPPTSLERGSWNRVSKGENAGLLIHLGGVGPARENAYVYEPSGFWVTASGVIPDGGRFDHETVPLKDGRFLLVGGRKWDSTSMGAKELILFDPPETGAIQASNFSRIPVGHDLIGASATLLSDGRVLILGGRDFDDAWSGSGIPNAYIFDPSNDTLTRAAPMKLGRTHHTATLLPNRHVLIAGGAGPGGVALSSMEVYDPEYWIRYQFRKVTDLPGPRAGMKPVRMGDGRVAFGGGLAGPASNRDLYVFDPKVETLVTVPGAFPMDIHGAPVFQPLRAPRGDHLLWIGRDRAGGEISSWSPSLLSFGSASPVVSDLPELRETFTATALSNGRWVVAGGSDGPTPTLCFNKAKVYQPSTNLWSDSANNMQTGRCNASAQVVPDGLANGRILITGGRTFAGGNLAQSEIFFPGANMFTAAGLPSLNAARHIHSQLTLWNGQTFVFGGNVGGALLSSSELSVGFRDDWTFAPFLAGPSMVAGMSDIEVGTLPNGEYLIVGQTNAPTGRCQIFNPFDLSFRDCSGALPAEFLADQGFFYVTVQSVGSKVLVTGGRGAATQIRGVYVFE
jgi:hypothetical protein